MSTTTKTVQIQVQDEGGHNHTFHIDYPASETTLTSIKNALAPAIATNSWRSTYGLSFIRVKGATIVETEKTKLDNGETAITILPNPATITTTTTTGAQTFMVEGMTIRGFNFQFLNGNSSIKPLPLETIIDEESNTLTVKFNTAEQGTAYYNVIITSGAYTFAIPTTITRN